VQKFVKIYINRSANEKLIKVNVIVIRTSKSKRLEVLILLHFSA